jgi:hypothetical protein
MSTAPAPPRFQIAFASKAPVAVIVRRSPTSWSQLVLWNMDSDTFTPGQWLHGRVAFANLSPNGKHLAMGIRHSKDKGQGFEYTLVSRPPYFTALAICFSYLQVSDVEFGENGALFWHPHKLVQWKAPNPCPYRLNPDFDGTDINRHDESEHPEPDQWITSDGRKLFAKDGVLYEEVDGVNVSLFDLNPFRHEAIETPDWALRW